MEDRHWFNLLEKLLGDDTPCKVCAVRAMCRRSFATRNGGGCPELQEAIQKAIEKNETEN